MMKIKHAINGALDRALDKAITLPRNIIWAAVLFGSVVASCVVVPSVIVALLL